MNNLEKLKRRIVLLNHKEEDIHSPQILESLRTLVRQTPNDQKLGSIIRNLLNKY